ncbi:MAG: glycyl-radical enzyme activating protein [Spirochaetes bacterium]|nr:MAG: glycyl-radical enzyme activating protein [Spirochaetota bacterium]
MKGESYEIYPEADGQAAAAGALVFDIQRFCLHDGPGVRTTVFFKGCTLACAWCQNPESHRAVPEMAFYADLCLGCFRCADACPSGAIIKDARARIRYSRCDACGRCAAACPADALRKIGHPWTAPALAAELARDIDFFTDGGGVTLSGGEPMLHAGFIRELVPLLKKRAIHVTMETAGHVAARAFERPSGLADLFYFDLKHADDARHRALTGAGNGLILENFRGLTRRGSALQARMPLVPGCNDDAANIAGTARIVRDAGLSSIHVLPWHGMGETKRARIDAVSKGFMGKVPDADLLESVKELFFKEGIDALIYR